MASGTTFLEYYDTYFTREIWPELVKYLKGRPGVGKVSAVHRGLSEGIFKFQVSMKDSDRSSFDVQINLIRYSKYVHVEIYLEDGRFHVNGYSIEYDDTAKFIGTVMAEKTYKRLLDLVAITQEAKKGIDEW